MISPAPDAEILGSVLLALTPEQRAVLGGGTATQHQLDAAESAAIELYCRAAARHAGSPACLTTLRDAEAFVHEKLRGRRRAAVSAHVASCAGCAAVLDRLPTIADAAGSVVSVYGSDVVGPAERPAGVPESGAPRVGMVGQLGEGPAASAASRRPSRAVLLVAGVLVVAAVGGATALSGALRGPGEGGVLELPVNLPIDVGEEDEAEGSTEPSSEPSVDDGYVVAPVEVVPAPLPEPDDAASPPVGLGGQGQGGSGWQGRPGTQGPQQGRPGAGTGTGGSWGVTQPPQISPPSGPTTPALPPSSPAAPPTSPTTPAPPPPPTAPTTPAPPPTTTPPSSPEPPPTTTPPTDPGDGSGGSGGSDGGSGEDPGSPTEPGPTEPTSAPGTEG